MRGIYFTRILLFESGANLAAFSIQSSVQALSSCTQNKLGETSDVANRKNEKQFTNLYFECDLYNCKICLLVRKREIRFKI